MSAGQRPISRRARERLIESHLPLVRAVAKRYVGRGADLDDLVQVGAIGLIKATDRFDPGRGTAFATFATPTIEGEIRHHLRDRAAAVRVPRDVQRLTGSLRRQEAELSASLGRAPTVTELARAVSADERDVERALRAGRAPDAIPLPAIDKSANAIDQEEPFGASDDRLLLADGMRSLDERDRRIVYLRFHADKTEREIAREVGLSQAQVSRRLARALATLRSGIAAGPQDPGHADTTPMPSISPGPGAPRPPDAGPSPAVRTAETEMTRSTGHRIDGVTGPRSDSTLVKHLNLPYHVTIRDERGRARSSWAASVDELPGCIARGQTPDEAVERVHAAMEAWLATAVAEAREVPLPAADSAAPQPASGPSHSGRFLVRMPSELHEQLALAAERRQLSLNRLVTEVLAASMSGEGHGRPAGADRATPPQRGTGSEPPRPARSLRLALATNLVVVVIAGAVAIALLVLALQRGI